MGPLVDRVERRLVRMVWGKSVAMEVNLRKFQPQLTKVMPDFGRILPSLTWTLGQQKTEDLLSSITLPTTAAMEASWSWRKDQANEIPRDTAPQSQGDFAKHVNGVLKDKRQPEISDSIPEHYFFVYHPANEWHAAFFDLQRQRARPLRGFMGLSDNLHVICWWMKKIRRWMRKQQPKEIEPEFHLLLPALQPISIKEKYTFPEELYPLTIEGLTDEPVPYIQLNLTNKESDGFKLMRIENATWLTKLWDYVSGGPEAIVLGVDPDDEEDDCYGSYQSDGSDSSDQRRPARRRRWHRDSFSQGRGFSQASSSSRGRSCSRPRSLSRTRSLSRDRIFIRARSLSRERSHSASRKHFTASSGRQQRMFNTLRNQNSNLGRRSVHGWKHRGGARRRD